MNFNTFYVIRKWQGYCYLFIYLFFLERVSLNERVETIYTSWNHSFRQWIDFLKFNYTCDGTVELQSTRWKFIMFIHVLLISPIFTQTLKLITVFGSWSLIFLSSIYSIDEKKRMQRIFETRVRTHPGRVRSEFQRQINCFSFPSYKGLKFGQWWN